MCTAKLNCDVIVDNRSLLLHSDDGGAIESRYTCVLIDTHVLVPYGASVSWSSFA